MMVKIGIIVVTIFTFSFLLCQEVPGTALEFQVENFPPSYDLTCIKLVKFQSFLEFFIAKIPGGVMWRKRLLKKIGKPVM